MMSQSHSKIFIVGPVSAVKPSSVTNNLRGRHLGQCNMSAPDAVIPPIHLLYISS